MKIYFKYVILFLLFISNVLFAQTPLPIYSPNFSSAGGWQINGNAAVISSSYGSNDYVNLPKPNLNSFTIEYWVKTTQVSPTGSQWYQGLGIVDA
jgi:hypothetical protein